MPPVFDSKKCVKCGRCVKDCPGYILELDKEPLCAHLEI